jgi:hypothetical protein
VAISDVEQLIRQRIETAKAAQALGGWVTYLIRDPRWPDLKGNSEGWPIYVGQTDEFSKRVRNHLRSSEKLARKGRGIKARIKDLLHADVVPNFEVLDRQPTRLRSLLSETNFARLCRTRGYDIANATTLQNRAGPPVTLRDLPTKWLWKFTLQQASQDGLHVEVVCTSCRIAVPLDIGLLQSLPEPPLRLEDIRAWSTLFNEPCDACGQKAPKRVQVHVH